jgi:alcohol dehydrogenase class IV
VPFEFATATRIIFGAGALEQVGPNAAALGRRALVVHGHTAERAAPLLHLLSTAGLETVTLAVGGEPTTHVVRDGVRRAREERCDMVIGCGGGSVLDAGKAIAALLTNSGDLDDYLEIIGQGKTLTQAAAPFVAIPTTAGTGSEVTRNAVLSAPEQRIKVSLRSPLMLPRLALVDPALAYMLPHALTAGTGLDALTQLIEPYVSRRANHLTDALCRDGIPRVARSLGQVYAHGDDVRAREDMAEHLAIPRHTMPMTSARARTWHWPACWVGWPWPTPGWERCTASRGPSGACSLLPMARCADASCRR